MSETKPPGGEQPSELPPLITVQEATAETVFDRQFRDLKRDLEGQRNLSIQIIIGVVIAFVFTIGMVSVEVILYHAHSDREYSEFQYQSLRDISDLRREHAEFQMRTHKQMDDIASDLRKMIEASQSAVSKKR